jgi:hypothetical protein
VTNIKLGEDEDEQLAEVQDKLGKDKQRSRRWSGAREG